LDKPLAEIGGKGLFTAELEAALREGSIDFAVHSLKDLPTDDPEGLCIAAIPERANPRDVLVGASLVTAKVVGTGSLRRAEQLKSMAPHVEIRGIRGNVDTRLAKLDNGDYDSIVLAAAGMDRLGIERQDGSIFSIYDFVPAPGQGALGLQARAKDPKIHALIRSIHHPMTARCVELEREFLSSIQGGCNVAAGCCVVPIEQGYQIDVFHQDAPMKKISFQTPTRTGMCTEILARLNG
jgi:hydroxymethylbilane synthase